MKIAECDVVIVPGLGNSGPDHWQSRWQAKFPNARRVLLRDWDGGTRLERVKSVIDAVDVCIKPVVLVAHSLGIWAVAHAASQLDTAKVRGAFLVGPPDIEDRDFPYALDASYFPVSRQPLPFPTLVAASRTDPYGSLDFARALARDWNAQFVDVGESGHINTASGHGPWPEGLMRFAGFMKTI